MKVKICGITNLPDALAAIEAGADLLGFNFYPKSPRYIVPEICAGICERLRQIYPTVLTVGVFVNESPLKVAAILHLTGLHMAQFSGDESVEVLAVLSGKAFKAVRLTTDSSADSEADKRTEADSSADSEADKRTGADSSADSEADKRTEADLSADCEADKRTEADSSADSEADKRTEADSSTDSEADKRTGTDYVPGVLEEYARVRGGEPPVLLVDAAVKGAYGGTGVTADWAAAARLAKQFPILLAGGLTRENVTEAVRQVRPWGVDVASGVETCPGRKDPEKVRQFICNARAAFRGLDKNGSPVLNGKARF